MTNNAPADVTVDNKSKVLIALPLVLIVILGVAATFIPFQIALSGPEQKILNFRPENLEIKKQREVVISSNLHSPINFGPYTAGYNPGAEGDLVPQLDYNDKSLSLIVISGEKKMAVINGSLLKEGETVGGMKIAKIEPGKVLLKNKRAKWLYLIDTKRD